MKRMRLLACAAAAAVCCTVLPQFTVFAEGDDILMKKLPKAV